MAERVELEDHYVEIAGRRWYARVARGRGRPGVLPVVLVHGFGISSSYFVPTAERLGALFDVYAPDLPGHGKSDAPPVALDVPGLAEALARWCRAVGIDRASFVANSMGCQTAAELALRHPALVDRLVLIGPTIDASARRLWKLVPRFLRGGLHERLTMTPLLLRDYARMGPRLLEELRFMLEDRIEEKLPRIEVPVILVRGEHDRVAAQPWLEHLAGRTRNARLVVIEGGAHAAQYGKADELIEAIAPFLREARSVRADG